MGRASTLRVAAFLTMVLTASAAGAEERTATPLVLSSQAIRQAVASAQQGIPTAPRHFAAPQQRASAANTGTRVLWTSIGAAGGFFAGAYLGAWIENAVAPCGCDDPGLKGAFIGMPIGAVAGGIAGWMLSK